LLPSLNEQLNSVARSLVVHESQQHLVALDVAVKLLAFVAHDQKLCMFSQPDELIAPSQSRSPLINALLGLSGRASLLQLTTQKRSSGAAPTIGKPKAEISGLSAHLDGTIVCESEGQSTSRNVIE
jgi:hypothetical protein